MSPEVRTSCPYCGVGCGVIVSTAADGAVSVRGDPEHPANFGRLCSKGAALAQTLDHEGRLLEPQIDGRPVSWEQALDRVAERFGAIIDAHGPEAVAFYVSGQLLTEDYYLANKLMKGFIGSANIDTNSRLCMSSAVAGHKRAFGTDSVPCSYTDLECARLIVITGSNLAWCHPVVFQRIAHARKQNPDLRVVVVDPRRTSTCDIADLHLAIRPGSDAMLFNGLLAHLVRAGKTDSAFVQNSTEGLQATLETARRDADDPARVAERCGLPLEQVNSFYQLFADTDRTVTLFSQGVNQFSTGTDNVNSIINCHLLTGRIGRAGAGPFSITGQPNAMGGREVGGLANQLAAHMELDNPAHRDLVKAFWSAPRIARQPGLKAVDLFEAVRSGKVKALWVMATNPAVSLPDTNRVREALAACECLVVSDCMQHTDTTRYAQVLLPAQTWGERDGTVTNSERCISRQRPFTAAPGQARPDWWIISEVARRLGHAVAFDYPNSAAIFREHAALSASGNSDQRAFNLSALMQIDDDAYDRLTPVQWPVRATPAGRLFADGRFYTSSRRARFIPVAAHGPARQVDALWPLVLNTGRLRDHWHTMTRTGKSARLSAHNIEPCIEIHPQDAQQYSVRDGELVQVKSQRGAILVRACVSDHQQPGCVFIPIHWNHRFSSLASVDQLVSAVTDPISGQPEFKYTPVSVQPWPARWYGFILSRRRLALEGVDYWAGARGDSHWRYEIAGNEVPEDWSASIQAMLCTLDAAVEWTAYEDRAARRFRAAQIRHGQLESCCFIGPDIRLPERAWLAGLFGAEVINDQDRRALLSGQSASGVEEAGPIICACFSVGRNAIARAIRDQACHSTEAIGECLLAGTNCGSCVPELKSLIAEYR
ncbi:MAG: nitrate reductase [Thiogranum sp.]|nr:nitrate reductase [Thiogranum sp.]